MNQKQPKRRFAIAFMRHVTHEGRIAALEISRIDILCMHTVKCLQNLPY
jgi:hypothetical protein